VYGGVVVVFAVVTIAILTSLRSLAQDRLSTYRKGSLALWSGRAPKPKTVSRNETRKAASLAGSPLLPSLPALPVEQVRQMRLGSHLPPSRDALQSPPAFPPQTQGDSYGANPQGCQRVAGGRSGQGGSDHRKSASERGAPRRGASGVRSSARSGSGAGLARLLGAGDLLHFYPEVAAPKDPRRPLATLWQPFGLTDPECPSSIGWLPAARNKVRLAARYT
jgi:hypothetical protein